MKKKKIKLTQLKVKSFMTELDDKQEMVIVGGKTTIGTLCGTCHTCGPTCFNCTYSCQGTCDTCGTCYVGCETQGTCP